MDIEQKDRIVAECSELMSKAGYDGTKIEQFCDTVAKILQENINHSDEQREAKYKLVKRLDCVEFRFDVSGDKIDPLHEGEGAEDRRFQNAINSVLFNPETSISFSYTPG